MGKKSKKVVQWDNSQSLEIARTTTNTTYLEQLSTHEFLLVRLAVVNNKHTLTSTLQAMQKDSAARIASRARAVLYERAHNR